MGRSQLQRVNYRLYEFRFQRKREEQLGNLNLETETIKKGILETMHATAKSRGTKELISQLDPKETISKLEEQWK